MLYIQKLDWKEFTVNTRAGGLLESFIKAQTPLCCGLGSNSVLEVYYTDTPDQSILDAVQEKWDAITADAPEAQEVIAGIQTASLQAHIQASEDLCEAIKLDFKTGNALLLSQETAGTNLLTIKGQIATVAQSVLFAISSGDADLVLAAIKAVPSANYDAKYITEARLLNYANQIRAFHGLAAVTALADA
jgi:hypothetical protein